MKTRLPLAVLLCVGGAVAAYYLLAASGSGGSRRMPDSAGPKVTAPPSATADATLAQTTAPAGALPAPVAPARKTHAPAGVELSLRSPAGIRTEVASRLIEGDQFEASLAKLREESMNDVEARELTEVYRKTIGAALGAADLSTAIDQLACGLYVCGMTFTSKKNQEDIFRAVLDAGQKSGVGIFSAVTNIVQRDDGTYEYRMIFSTDPAMNKLSVPPPRPGAPKPG